MKRENYVSMDPKRVVVSIVKNPLVLGIILLLFLDLVCIILMGIWEEKAWAESPGFKLPPLRDEVTAGWMLRERRPWPPDGSGQGKLMRGMGPGEHPFWRYLKDLDLTEQQKGEILLMKSRMTKELISKRAAEEIAALELKDLLDKDPVKMKAVEIKLKQIETLRSGIHLTLLRTMEEIKTKLTPGQRIKLQEALKVGLRENARGSIEKVPPPCPGPLPFGDSDDLMDEPDFLF